MEVQEEGRLLVCTADLDNGGYPRLVMEDSSWRSVAEATARMGSRWSGKRNTIAAGGQVRAYVALRVDAHHPRYDALEDVVRASAKGWQRQLGAGWQGTSTRWPCFRYLLPTGQTLDITELLRRACYVEERDACPPMKPGCLTRSTVLGPHASGGIAVPPTCPHAWVETIPL